MKMKFIFILAIFILFCFLPESLHTKAEEEISIMQVEGKKYQFDKKDEYIFLASQFRGSTSDNDTLGKFCVKGKIQELEQSEMKIPVYQANEKETITFIYQTDTYNWIKMCLISDSTKKISDVELNGKIENGAVLVQTSLNHSDWVTVYQETNTFAQDSYRPGGFYQTNSTQLLNGCYYRITIAYETKRQSELASTKTWNILTNKPEYNYWKHAEVYEFYIQYPQTNELKKMDTGKVLGSDALQKTKKNNGYSQGEPVVYKDLHYGWELGKFYLKGATDTATDPETGTQVFLKNLNDQLVLSFALKQNIDKLDGNPKLSIVSDEKGYDQLFQVKKTDFGRGTLLVRQTDYNNEVHFPVIYTNYLEALASPGVQSYIQFFEEGNYEVALDYKITDFKGVNTTEDYKIYFKFEIRNGNCMVYPVDSKTESDLKNKSSTENGFYLDFAKSRYLKINVTRTVWEKGRNGYTDDEKFSRPAKDGDKYTEEGVYTIEVKNQYTGKEIKKVIYVGTDNVLKAAVSQKDFVNHPSESIDEISDLMKKGATIADNGKIIMPETKPATTQPETTTTTTIATTTTTATTSPAVSTTIPETTSTDSKSGFFDWIGQIFH